MWDGRDGTGRSAPSGMYLYRLQADEKIVARAMQLVR